MADMGSHYRARLNLSSSLRLTSQKIKDLKPMHGLVFRELLASYSHWAFGDVDVVYGSLKRFLTECAAWVPARTLLV